MTARYTLPDPDTLLLIEGTRSFLLAGVSGTRFPLCLETSGGEICTTIEEGDIVAVSAPEGGPLEPAVMLLELVRTYRHPVVVLPHGHPGSRRLQYVVSSAPEIVLSCAIQRGTHPDQHLLCSSDELAGVILTGSPGHIETGELPPGVHAHLVRLSLRLDQETRGDLTHP
jgi:hypothetical protein